MHFWYSLERENPCLKQNTLYYYDEMQQEELEFLQYPLPEKTTWKAKHFHKNLFNHLLQSMVCWTSILDL